MEIINYNNELFLIRRKCNETAESTIRQIKDDLKADIILKKDNMYFVCNQIDTIEFEELITSETLIKTKIEEYFFQFPENKVKLPIEDLAKEIVLWTDKKIFYDTVLEILKIGI